MIFSAEALRATTRLDDLGGRAGDDRPRLRFRLNVMSLK